MDSGIADTIDGALKEIYDAGEIQKRQTQAFFIPNYLPRDQAAAHLTEKRDTAATIINELKQ